MWATEYVHLKECETLIPRNTWAHRGFTECKDMPIIYVEGLIDCMTVLWYVLYYVIIIIFFC